MPSEPRWCDGKAGSFLRVDFRGNLHRQAHLVQMNPSWRAECHLFRGCFRATLNLRGSSQGGNWCGHRSAHGRAQMPGNLYKRLQGYWRGNEFQQGILVPNKDGTRASPLPRQTSAITLLCHHGHRLSFGAHGQEPKATKAHQDLVYLG